ncbi:dirigent protein 19-like [Herrania umbratica]|uniref:Dirigent protein n=1 Tax=Herrania umbratica TaxID=108875 RepID=A0A6J1A4W4_9ROSI|nr:dirigent protein 19-like [Herrania umbratica]
MRGLNFDSDTYGLKKEKLSHFRFYFHDVLNGPRPTAVRVASATMTSTSATFFGFMVMMDNPLTVAPEFDSKLVGRAQGIYASASQSEVGLLMVLNIAFTQGKHNGSALSVLGRNPVFSTVREMQITPIVGGSGLFRFARGYAEARSHSRDAKTRGSVYVFHC